MDSEEIMRERVRDREIIARACSQYVTHGVRACVPARAVISVCVFVRARLGRSLQYTTETDIDKLK